MNYDHFRAAVDLLIAEIVRVPEDAEILLDQLQRTLAQMEATGQPLPSDLIALHDWVEKTVKARGPEDPPPELPQHFLDWREGS